MDYKELISLALSNLKGNILRTLLTMLGIIIGIASVIIIMSMGQGATASIVDRISTLGANTVNVFPGARRRGPGSISETVTSLVPKDVEAMAELENVEAVSGVVSARTAVSYQGSNMSASINGVEADYQLIQSLEVDLGSFFDKSQVKGMAKVAVIGIDVVSELFEEGDEPLGKAIRVDGKSFRVIGVLEQNDASGMSNPNEAIYIPLDTMMKTVIGQNYLGSIAVLVTDSESVDGVVGEVENLLIDRHEIIDMDLKDFTIMNFQEMISTISNVTGILTTLLSAIAAISLLVGGIGIMNIMLVTVTERTKEIGLLKSIGAKNSHILNQFLLEAVVLTVTGGLIGVTIGVGISFVIAKIVSIPFIVKFSSVIIAVGVSSLVGVVFGYYPARNAAKLSPIDALRYE
jgi:putative ABC transport system permease protein